MKENWMTHATLLQELLLSYGNWNHFALDKWINLENAVEKRTEKRENNKVDKREYIFNTWCKNLDRWIETNLDTHTAWWQQVTHNGSQTQGKWKHFIFWNSVVQPVGCDPMGVEWLFLRSHIRPSVNTDNCIMMHHSSNNTVMKQQWK